MGYSYAMVVSSGHWTRTRTAHQDSLHVSHSGCYTYHFFLGNNDNQNTAVYYMKIDSDLEPLGNNFYQNTEKPHFIKHVVW